MFGHVLYVWKRERLTPRASWASADVTGSSNVNADSYPTAAARRRWQRALVSFLLLWREYLVSHPWLSSCGVGLDLGINRFCWAVRRVASTSVSHQSLPEDSLW